MNDAKEKGYAEAIRPLISTVLMSAKLVIMANWLMGMKVTMKDVKCSGITKVNLSDVKEERRAVMQSNSLQCATAGGSR